MRRGMYHSILSLQRRAQRWAVGERHLNNLKYHA
jgi:hypothetical protein